MSDRQFQHAVRDWLEAGSDRTPSRAVDAVLLAVKTTPQERARWTPQRFFNMPTHLRLAVAAATIAVIGAGALASYVEPPGFGNPNPGATPTESSTASPDPSVAWVTFASQRYPLTIARPAGWIDHRATRDWSWELDASLTEPSRGSVDYTTNPAESLAVLAWSIPLQDGESVATSAELEDWVAGYCDRMGNTPCDRIAGRAVPMCLGVTCAPVLIVPFESDVQAFFLDADGDMAVVAVWRPDLHPTTVPFGGGIQMLQTILAPMGIGPPEGVASPAGS